MFTLGKRGSTELHHDGYVYRQRKERGSRTYWTCISRDCSASCTLLNGTVLKLGTAHNHPQSPTHYEFQRHHFKFRMKELALSRNEKPLELFNILLNEVEEDAREFVLKNKLFYTSYASAVRSKRDQQINPSAGMDEEGGMDYKMIPQPRGSVLLFQGYKFSRKGRVGGCVRWGCMERTCEAICLLNQEGWLTVKNSNHNHPPPTQSNLTDMAIRYQLWQLAVTTDETPIEIIRQVAPNEDDEHVILRYKRSIIQARRTRDAKKPLEITYEGQETPETEILEEHEEEQVEEQDIVKEGVIVVPASALIPFLQSQGSSTTIESIEEWEVASL